MACRNPRLALQRARRGESLLQAVGELLAPIRASVTADRLQGEAAIGPRVGAALNRYKVRKHFECTIGDTEFAYRRQPDSIAHEAALDGVYVIRTSLAAGDLSAPDCVRSYKAPTQVERAFRTRDPVAPAEPSASAKRQKATRRTTDGTPLHSFRTLLEDLATVTRNVCRTKGETDMRQTEFALETQLSAEQARAVELLKGIRI